MTEQLIKLLLDAGIVKTRKENEKSFILKSGNLSRLFIDIKEASLNPEILREIVTIIDDKLAETDLYDIDFDVIGSVAIGGVPIASVYSYIASIPHIIVREEKHERGMESQVIGSCKGKYVLLIEDVATTGNSVVKAVKAIREAGGLCNDCIVVVDRQEGSTELCKENGIDLHSILRKSDFGVIE